VFDDERDGMLRKDRFFLGTSVGFGTVCEDVSFRVGIETAPTVGDSVGAVVGLMEFGVCEVSNALPCQRRAVKRITPRSRSERRGCLGRCAKDGRENLQLVFGVEDECCGTGGWPRSTPVLLPLMWGGELPLRGQVFEMNMLES
jgi:hypothetical protein